MCGSPRMAEAFGGQCARCLLSLATTLELGADVAGQEGLLGSLQVRSFGDYELQEEISRGGMGVVYRAWQRSLNREVAVKMILAGELAGPSALRMFLNEARAAATLHHPNIVPVYETGEHEMQHFFSMRYVPGGRSIAHWAAERRGSHRQIAAAVADVARAVEHAHERGVLHRDLKPSNVLWDAQVGPQVTDFGLAKLLEAKDAAITGSVLMAGSPSYMAPEQVSGGEITTATDVHGMGALLYELLQGRPPYLGKTVVETARQVLEESPAPLTAVPRELRTICLKSLAKRPTDRYRTAAALAEDLECFARGEPVSALPLTRVERVLNWVRRKPRQAALLGLTLLSFFSGMGGVLWQWSAATRANAAQKRTLEHMRWQEVGRWLKEGQTAKALAYLAAQIRAYPERWQPVMYAMSIVDQHTFAYLAGPLIRPQVKLVLPAQLSPDGQWVAGAGADRVLRVWQVEHGQQMAEWQSASGITSIATTEGRYRMAAGHEDGRVSLFANWQSAPVQLPVTMPGAVKGVLFVRDVESLLVWRSDGAEIWRLDALESGPVSFKMEADTQDVQISADGRRAMLWHPRRAQVWEIEPGGPRLLFGVDAWEKFHDVKLSLNGACLAAADGTFSARTWEVASGQERPPIHSSPNVLRHISLDGEGQYLTVAGDRTDISVHEVESGLRVSGLMNHQYQVDSMALSRDGKVTATLGADHVLRLWDARSGIARCSPLLLGKGGRPLPAPRLSYSGDAVLVDGLDELSEALVVWRMTGTRAPIIHEVKGCFDYNSGCMTEDGRLAAVGLYPSNRCRVIEPLTGKVRLDRQANGNVYVTLFSHDRRQCYALTANGWVHGWDMETGEELWPANQQPGKIRPGVLSPDGTRLLAGHNDGHIRVYDTSSGQVVMILAHPGEVKSLRFSPDDSGRFISTSTNGLAHVWDLASGRKLQTLSGHEGTIIASGWSPDGRRVVTASYDGSARVWEVRTGRQVGAPMRHLAWLSHVEFSPDGRYVATACRDGNARLWHADTGLPASDFLPQGQSCETVRFTADGAALLVRDLDGFQFWDTEHAEAVSVHFPAQATGGLGMDSPSWRAILTAHGDFVFLSYSMNYGMLWRVEQPRGPAPAWFPEFLESLALLSLDETTREHGAALALHLSGLRQTVLVHENIDPFAQWARRVLGMAAAESP